MSKYGNIIINAEIMSLSDDKFVIIVGRKLVGPHFRFLEFCGLFVDYEFFNVSTSDRVAITHAKSKSTNNPHLTHKIRKSGPSSFRLTTVRKINFTNSTQVIKSFP